MKQNLGKADRLIRVAAAAIIAVLYSQNFVTGTAAIVLLIAGAVLLLTALTGTCPLYRLTGICTRRNNKV